MCLRAAPSRPRRRWVQCCVHFRFLFSFCCHWWSRALCCSLQQRLKAAIEGTAPKRPVVLAVPKEPKGPVVLAVPKEGSFEWCATDPVLLQACRCQKHGLSQQCLTHLFQTMSVLGASSIFSVLKTSRLREHLAYKPIPVVSACELCS